ncbi:calcium-binding protein [Roseicella aquatilis]|uniref:calcium-binding protein n=1 Tax=Roseicella aquatilis TaxID=2527868 RepID=UPI001405267A|nr:calcium-binding protein [Roseicella aquatilis]
MQGFGTTAGAFPFQIHINSDLNIESDEDFYISFYSSVIDSAFGIPPVARAKFTILDDDKPRDLSLTGTAKSDALTGSGGNDTLWGLVGNDTLNGGIGNDVLLGGAGADSIIGGSGVDTANYESATAGVTVALSAPASNTGDAKGDTFSSIENLRGSAYIDRLVTAGGANRLEGLAGDDELVGGAGADTLDGGAGTQDLASYENASAGVTASLAAPAGNTGDASGDVYINIEALRGSTYADKLTGNAGANKLVGLAGNDTLSGGDGNDTLFGGIGADSLVGGNNSDTASYETAAAGVAVFLLTPVSNTGEAKGDTFSSIENLRGSAYADRLVGGAGSNMLEGLAGNDTLEGGSGGNDKLTGGVGADWLIGGSGGDTFVYKATNESTAATMDLIADFSKAQGDRIDLSAIDARPGLAGDQAFLWKGVGAFAGGGLGSLRSYQNGNDTYVAIDTGDGTADMVIRLTGLIALTASDFIL